MSFDPPERIDPYLNATVYGNILDYFENYTYNLRLYMVRESLASTLDADEIFDSDIVIPEEDQITLAQTGVTGTSIDNLEIETLGGAGSKVNTKISFTVTEPGSADFLDEIKLSKIFLGYKNTPTATFFMDITFKGYEAGTEEGQEGGKPTEISGYRYKMELVDFSMSLDATGATYEITALPENHTGYIDRFMKFHRPTQTQGKTVLEHLESLQDELRIYFEEENPRGEQYADKIIIDTSRIIAQEDANNLLLFFTIPSDEELETGAKLKNDIFNRITVSNPARGAQKSTGVIAEEINDADMLSIPEGVSIEQYLITLLSMSPKMRTIVSRKTNLNLEDEDADPARAYTGWLKIDTKSRIIKYDELRNVYQREITIIPFIHKNTRTDVAIAKKEQDVTRGDKDARLQQYITDNVLMKSYNYIFTGLNDQILSLDITYDSGYALLISPDMIYQTESPFISGAGQGPTQQQQESIDRITQPNELTAEGYTARQLEQLAEQSGVSLSRLNDRLRDIQETGGTFNVTSQAGLNAVPTSSDDLTIDNPFATIDLNRQYSNDLLNSNFLVDVDEAVRENRVTADQLIIASKVVPENIVEVRQNPVQRATSSEQDTQNSQFGQLSTQYAQDRFLLQITMGIRGDPWYLGSPLLDRSTPEMGNFVTNDNLFWLRLARPTRFDPDVDEEDNNTGYWKPDGTSRSFTGLYRTLGIRNKFSGGQYTCEIDAHRILDYGERVNEVIEAEAAVQESFGVLRTDENDT